MTVVLDLSGMGMRHMSKEALSYTRRISDIFHYNYSGMTTSLLVVNAPWVFSKGWQIIEGKWRVFSSGREVQGYMAKTAFCFPGFFFSMELVVVSWQGLAAFVKKQFRTGVFLCVMENITPKDWGTKNKCSCHERYKQSYL